MDEWRRSGQIPAFGDWDHASDLPITQYFESARQAGLNVRYSSSSGECGHHYFRGGSGAAAGVGAVDLYAAAAADYRRPSRNNTLPAAPRKTRIREKRGGPPHVKEQRKQGKVFDVTEPPRKLLLQQQQQQDKPMSVYKIVHDQKAPPPPATRPKLPSRAPKAVDEDLYKIPPELLRSSKRKKMPGFFACLVPSCAS